GIRDFHVTGVQTCALPISNAEEPVFYATRQELRKIYPPVDEDPICACAALPLKTSQRTLGTLVIGYDRPHHFTADERATLTSLRSEERRVGKARRIK